MIKAIETRYKGYRFRSRLEARWAVFFDALDIPFEYEKEGFDLGAAGWYLPDFWLPTQQTWMEIKPDQNAVVSEEKKLRAFQQGVGNVKCFFVACGAPWLGRDFEDIGKPDCSILEFYPSSLCDGKQWCRCPLCGRFDLFDPYCPCDGEWSVYCMPCDLGTSGVPHTRRSDKANAWFYKGDSQTSNKSLIFPEILFNAYAAARSARFEHGENG